MEDKIVEYEECYIAFMDLLGFKKRIERQSCEEILKIYDKMKVPLKRIVHNGIDLMEEDDIRAKVMSDSICFYVNAQKPNGLFALLSACMLFQIELAKQEEPILVRGAIVKGGIYAKGDVMFGPGLTTAYLLEEKSAVFPRIILLKRLLDELVIGGVAYNQASIDGMVTADKDEFYIINYFKFLDTLGAKESKEKLCAYVEAMLATEFDGSVREKYRYIKEKLECEG